ncbi:tbc1 domain family member [Anaeramoeba flamelloides]|uniref:Tbc1 domain family member n=1 Tax=Anaeramoeba flamelloides TaxID=1746091 RepID=A0AAV7YYU8_9EUKA|nr:tbc1 domain family member [Anaeramoeba flamelloides]
MDVHRTMPGSEFFDQQSIKNLMTDLLIIYANVNKKVNYKQGMHELLAAIIFLINQEYHEITNQNEHPTTTLFNKKYLAHDSYLLFDLVMSLVGKLYTTPPLEDEEDEKDDSNHKEERNNKIQKQNILQNAPFSKSLSQNNEPENDRVVNESVIICKFIYSVILKSKDPQLYLFLKYIGIEIQVFALQWIRLLVFREFKIEEVYGIWDYLFADDNPMDFLEHFCASMLIHIRHKVICRDVSTAMKTLFNYPKGGDVETLIHNTLKLRDTKCQLKGLRGLINQEEVTHIANIIERSMNRQKKSKNNGKNKKLSNNQNNNKHTRVFSGFLDNFSRSFADNKKKKKKKKTQYSAQEYQIISSKVEKMKNDQKEVAAIMENSLELIQEFIKTNSSNILNFKQAMVFNSLLTLKQINAILFGRIEMNDLRESNTENQNPIITQTTINSPQNKQKKTKIIQNKKLIIEEEIQISHENSEPEELMEFNAQNNKWSKKNSLDSFLSSSSSSDSNKNINNHSSKEINIENNKNNIEKEKEKEKEREEEKEKEKDMEKNHKNNQEIEIEKEKISNEMKNESVGIDYYSREDSSKKINSNYEIEITLQNSIDIFNINEPFEKKIILNRENNSQMKRNNLFSKLTEEDFLLEVNNKPKKREKISKNENEQKLTISQDLFQKLMIGEENGNTKEIKALFK